MSYEALNDAGLLSIALMPQWEDQTVSQGTAAGWDMPLPTSLSAGVYLQASPKAMVMVATRAFAHRREALVTVDTLDATANYTTTISGTAIATTSGTFGTADIVLVELKAKIAADATVGGAAGGNQIVTSVLLDSAGAETLGTVAGGNPAVSLQIQGTVEADFYLAISATGTGVLAATADASTFDVQVLSTMGGIIRSGSTGYTLGWVAPGDSLYSGQTSLGWVERQSVAGIDRLYLQVLNITGHVSDGATVLPSLARVSIGPAVLEATT